MVYHALSHTEFEIRGGLGLPPLREGDRCLVDTADPDDYQMVRQGCHATEAWRCSEVLTLDGTGLSRAADPNGPLEKAAGRERSIY